MGDASTESKLLQNMTAMREEVLYEIFLDLQKACDDLEWGLCLYILVAYGVGQQVIHLLR